MKSLICSFILVLLASSLDTGAHPYAQPFGGDRALEGRVDEYVKPYLDLGGFNGSVLIAKQGKVLLSKGYGMANYELSVPNTAHTKFHLGSISKTFTAAAIMILQEQGKLSVRDPVHSRLSKWRQDNHSSFADEYVGDTKHQQLSGSKMFCFKKSP